MRVFRICLGCIGIATSLCRVKAAKIGNRGGIESRKIARGLRVSKKRLLCKKQKRRDTVVRLGNDLYYRVDELQRQWEEQSPLEGPFQPWGRNKANAKWGDNRDCLRSQWLDKFGIERARRLEIRMWPKSDGCGCSVTELMSGLRTGWTCVGSADQKSQSMTRDGQKKGGRVMVMMVQNGVTKKK